MMAWRISEGAETYVTKEILSVGGETDQNMNVGVIGVIKEENKA